MLSMHYTAFHQRMPQTLQPNTTIAAPWLTNNYTMATKKRKAIATTALAASGKGKGNNVGIKKTTKLHPTTEFEYDDDDDDDSNEICWLANAH